MIFSRASTYVSSSSTVGFLGGSLGAIAAEDDEVEVLGLGFCREGEGDGEERWRGEWPGD